VDAIVKNLSLYGIDHHSQAIKDLIPHLIERNLPSLPKYLDSRLI